MGVKIIETAGYNGACTVQYFLIQFPRTIFFLDLEIQRSQYIRPKIAVHKCVETIQGQKLLKDRNYMRKCRIQVGSKAGYLRLLQFEIKTVLVIQRSHKLARFVRQRPISTNLKTVHILKSSPIWILINHMNIHSRIKPLCPFCVCSKNCLRSLTVAMNELLCL